MNKRAKKIKENLKSILAYDLFDCLAVEGNDWQEQCKLMFGIANELKTDFEKLLADYERMEKALEIAYDVMENARNKDKSDICDKGLSRLNKALAEEQGE